MSDLNTLLASEQANRTDHHWAVAFSVRVHDSLLPELKEACACEQCGEEHNEEIGVIGDTIIVGCGPDAQVAIDRVKVHVLDEAKYGIKINVDSFKLQGVKLLSIQEL